MADFDKIEVYGTVYNVKDTTARNDSKKALDKSIEISYAAESTTIKIVKVNIGE